MAILAAEGCTFPISIPLIVIGGGACGSVAALAAHERGAQVVILERDSVSGGDTALSSGQIPAAGTKLQRIAGAQDSWEILERDLIAKNKGQCDVNVARRIAQESAGTIDWLVDRHRLPLSSFTGFNYPGNSAPHMHTTPNRLGSELTAALSRALVAEGIETVNFAQVIDFYVTADAKITGVAYVRPNGNRETVGCEALMLACGGFGANRELVRKHIPAMANAPHHGHEGNDGSAVLWGRQLGASLKDMGSFQGHGALCTPHMVHLSWGVFGQGGFQVNCTGARFSNETSGVSEQALKVLGQPGGVAWAIWDLRCDAIAAQIHSHVDAQKSGAVRSFSNIKTLADFIGSDASALANTIKAVNAYSKGEDACPWGRDFTKFPPLQPPYLAAKVTGALFHTQGGLEIDTNARVLRSDGSVFPNLFAGGGAARGLSGPADWGYLPGSGLLTAINMGKIAGEFAGSLVVRAARH